MTNPRAVAIIASIANVHPAWSLTKKRGGKREQGKEFRVIGLSFERDGRTNNKNGKDGEEESTNKIHAEKKSPVLRSLQIKEGEEKVHGSKEETSYHDVKKLGRRADEVSDTNNEYFYDKGDAYAKKSQDGDAYSKQPIFKPGTPQVPECDRCIGEHDDEVCRYTDKEVGCASCVGGYVCNSEKLVVDDTSCVGKYACSYAYGIKVGWNSCIGYAACQSAFEAMIGSKSCHGYIACFLSEFSTIGTSSCIGSTYYYIVPGYSPFAPATCALAPGITVGDGSCIGSGACNYSYRMTVESNACIGPTSCVASNELQVDKGSCLGFVVCSANYNGGSIGYDSCHGYNNCQFNLERVIIGNRSCKGDRACSFADGELQVGDHSCTGTRACSSSEDLIVESQSCNGINACRNATFGVVIGSNSCNCDNCCRNLPEDCYIAANQCNDAEGSCMSTNAPCVITPVSSAVAAKRVEKIAAAELKRSAYLAKVQERRIATKLRMKNITASHRSGQL